MDEIEGVKDNYLTESDAPRLSPAREKILMALLNPEFIGLTVTEKCQRIGVSRQAWYTALHDEKFMELVNKTSLDVLKEGVAGVMAALLKSASNPSPKSNPDRRLFFELTGHTMKEFGGQNIVVVKVDG
jgi:hypothetical protein